VTIDKSGSNVAALEAMNAGRRKRIVVRQVKYLNNIVEQDHRAIKRRTRPMLGFKDFRCARILLSGIELMHMIKKRQMKNGGALPLDVQHLLTITVVGEPTGRTNRNCSQLRTRVLNAKRMIGLIQMRPWKRPPAGSCG
jgi:hypothetical protein